METKKLTCIGCPMGCQITVKYDASDLENAEVTGNTCKIGYNYALSEITNPTRVVTGTVGVKNRDNLVVSVKTAKPVPKGEIDTVAKILKEISVEAPLKIGDRIEHGKDNLCFELELVVTRNVE